MTTATLPEIPSDRLALLDTCPLLHGGHPGKPDNECCARELIHLVVTGTKADETPACLTETLSAIPALNDQLDDEQRERVIRPYLKKLLRCPRDQAADRRRMYKLAEYARQRAIARLRARKFTKEAAMIEALAPIIDEATAIAARDGIRLARKSLPFPWWSAAAADAAAAAWRRWDGKKWNEVYQAKLKEYREANARAVLDIIVSEALPDVGEAA